MNGFEDPIPDPNSKNPHAFVAQCKNCGKFIECGLFSITGHWAECGGKGFSQAMLETAAKNKSEGKPLMDIETVEKLRKEHLP